MRLGRHVDAIQALRQALCIQLDDADAWAHLAIAYELSGNRRAALAAVQELRGYDPAKVAATLFDRLVRRLAREGPRKSNRH